MPSAGHIDVAGTHPRPAPHAATIAGPARLLPRHADSGRPLDLRRWTDHVEHFGPLPAVPVPRRGRAGALLDEVAASGLRGRGGGWFPAARKWQAVVDASAERRGRGARPEVIANAMEGEPASHKDAVLIAHSPHLVLDGLVAAAVTIGARRAHIAAHRGSATAAALQAAIDERGDRDPVAIELLTPPGRYVASEESALAHWAGGGTATPVFGERPFRRGMNGRPTLVQNAETLAHVGLIARFGAAWFRALGHPDAPGTTLVTVGGSVQFPGVLEVPVGTSVADLLLAAGGLTGPVDGFLTGGYGGAWVGARDLLAADWDPDSIAAAGGVIGAGVLWALDPAACPLAELVRVLDYLAGESAGQCGPCRFGLPAVADDVRLLADRRAGDEALAQLDRRLALVSRRGGCRHPDGAARFAATGLEVFRDEVHRHRAGSCSAGAARSWLPVPEARMAPVTTSARDFS